MMVEKKRSRQKDQNKSQIKVQIAKSQICLSLSRGAVAERSKAAGLGPVLSGGVGSNPTGVISSFLQVSGSAFRPWDRAGTQPHP